MTEVHWHVAARAEVRAAHRYYLERNADAAAAFFHELDRVIEEWR